MRIYENLSVSSALVPPMVAILLDGESRAPEQRLQFERISGGKLRFLDRTMLENYLLDIDAISAVLVELGQPTTPEAVQHALLAALGANALPRDAATVDGASILKKVFAQLSDARQEFRKTRDVPALVEWVIKEHPDRLEALRICLRRTFSLSL